MGYKARKIRPKITGKTAASAMPASAPTGRRLHPWPGLQHLVCCGLGFNQDAASVTLPRFRLRSMERFLYECGYAEARVGAREVMQSGKGKGADNNRP